MKLDVLVGTYSENVLCGDGSVFRGRGEGVCLFRLDTETGALTRKGAVRTENPSFVAVNRAGTAVYAVNELEEWEGEPGGGISWFSLDHGKLSPAGRGRTYGLDPCHAALTPDQRHLCVANYGTGSLCVYALEADGRLGGLEQLTEHEGRGKDPVRQAGPHCHSTAFSPDGKWAVVAELGTDQLLCCRLAPEGEPLRPGKFPVFRMDPGDGPRICRFDRAGRYAYVACELSNTVQVLRFSSEDGSFCRVQTVSTLPEGADPAACAFADLCFSGDGRFLYGSNRGHDSLVTFGVSPEDGRLTPLSWQPCGGRTPRSFTVDPTGQFLLCANQDSDNLAVFRIDRDSGGLTLLDSVPVGSPTCVVCGEALL